MFDNYTCRAKCKDNGEWLYGYYVKHNTVMTCFASDNPRPKHYIVNDGYACDWGFEPPLQATEVDPETVGQFTGCREFVMTDASIGAPLFEGDIVEVWVHRQCGSEGFKSKHDGYCKVRGVIVFRRGEFIVDLNNEYNNNIFAAKGKEQYDRDLPSHIPLHRFNNWYSKNLDWQREHNKNYYYDDIIRIGNIFDNPKLMED